VDRDPHEASNYMRILGNQKNSLKIILKKYERGGKKIRSDSEENDYKMGSKL
jgi:hypothetical protein